MALNKSLELIPNERIPFDVYMLSMVNTLYKLQEDEKAREVANKILENSYQDLDYLISLDKPYSNYLTMEKRFAAHVFSELIKISQANGDRILDAEINQRLRGYGESLNTIFR